jgi:hypothetical protein
MRALKTAVVFPAKLALVLSPALAGALWLYVGYAAWREFGWPGLLAWEIPTLATALHMAWSSYASTRSQIEMSGLNEEELMQKYQDGSAFFMMGPSTLLPLFWMGMAATIGRNWFLQALSWLSIAILVLELALTVFASWIGAAILLGSVIGTAGFIIGVLTPMLLMFHWMFEVDKLQKAHPECVGGT